MKKNINPLSKKRKPLLLTGGLLLLLVCVVLYFLPEQVLAGEGSLRFSNILSLAYQSLIYISIHLMLFTFSEKLRKWVTLLTQSLVIFSLPIASIIYITPCSGWGCLGTAIWMILFIAVFVESLIVLTSVVLVSTTRLGKLGKHK